MPAQPNPSAIGPIKSQFSNDPDMREIVELFVQEMPERIEAINTLWRDQQLNELRRAAHQLKGAGGGYGFPTVGQAAARLEQSLMALEHGSAKASIDTLRTQFEELVSLCRAVTM